MYKQSHSKYSFLLFLLGLGSCTQIYFFGCIAISELAVFLISPFLYISNYSEMRRLGFTKFLNMVLMVMVSLFVSSWYNHTAFPFVFKSFATIYSVWAYFVVYYKLLKNNLNGLKWMFIGVFISSIISIYAFNPTAQVSESGFAQIGDAEVEDIIGGQLFWLSKFKDLVHIPICGFYFNVPLIASILIPIAYLGVALATTVSGRASSIAIIISGVMIFVGRKKREKMASIGRHFFTYLILGLLVLLAIKQAYVYAAKNGYLSDKALTKYEHQSAQGEGILSLLMSGRTGFFTAIPAALSRPIVGYGPFARDEEGYAERFILKYGSEQDIAAFRMSEHRAMMMGYKKPIPTHSYIMGAWIHYGIGGLIFYVWVLFLIYQHIKKYSAAIPQWYGYFAMMLPYYLWNIFFSPFGYRWQFTLLMSCLFFARAVSNGLLQLPYSMILEVEKHEK